MKYNTLSKSLFKTLEYYIFEKFNEKKIINKINNSKCISEIKKLAVLSGPFAGMRYPSFKSHGSAFYPKILGTYEREINKIIESIIDKRYDVIIDVGCAEGYYAVGIAMKIPNSKVYAYDIASEARGLCSELAKQNKVENRIIIRETFTLEEYQNILNENPDSRILIISDIEGAEKDVFDKRFKKHVKNTDFIIEIHDFVDTEVTQKITDFVRGMKQEKIFSLSDFQKSTEYNDEILNDLDFETKHFLLKEGRPEQMKWIYAY